MKKQTIAQKRAILYREWLLATLSVDEYYYISTLTMGIPDGDTQEMVLEDLQEGFYDEDIDYTISIYLKVKSHYGKSGYYAHGQIIYNEDEALKTAGFNIPERIYKRSF